MFHQHGIPFVIGSCWSDSLTAAGYDEIFRTSVYSSKLAENMVAVMAANGIKKAASLVEVTDYGIGIAENIENAIKKLNVDIDFQYEVVEKTSKDFVPVLLKYKTKVKPEVLLVAVPQPGQVEQLLAMAMQWAIVPANQATPPDGLQTENIEPNSTQPDVPSALEISTDVSTGVAGTGNDSSITPDSD